MSKSLEELIKTPLEGRLVRAKELAFRLGISTSRFMTDETEDFPQKIRLARTHRLERRRSAGVARQLGGRDIPTF